jgi:hypothetical protein
MRSWRRAPEDRGRRKLRPFFAGENEEGSPSFLKKSSKKLLFCGGVLVKRPATGIKKVFWFFFSKKNVLLTLITA